MQLLSRSALLLSALTALGLAAARPANAQNLTYTLSNVTFTDGGQVTGFFDYNPTTNIVGNYAVVTTTGSGPATGTSYSRLNSGPFLFNSRTFEFLTTGLPGSLLALSASSSITSPGVYTLNPGTFVTANSLSGSGEFTPTGNRVVGPLSPAAPPAGPSLVVTFAAPAVPETSTAASFGLLLALGLGGLGIAAKRRKTVATTAARTAAKTPA